MLTNDLRAAQTILDSIDNAQVYLGELQTLQQEIEELSDRNTSAMRSLQKSEGERDRIKSRLADTERLLEESKDREGDMEVQIQKLQRDLETAKTARPVLTREPLASLGSPAGLGPAGSTAAAGVGSRMALREKNQEINSYLDEIKDLKHENVQFKKECEELTEELDATIKALEKQTGDNKDLRDAVDDADVECQKLLKERDMVKSQLTDIAQQLNLKDSMEEGVMGQLQRQLSSWRDTLSHYQDSLFTKDEKIKDLQAELKILQDELERAGISGYKQTIEEREAEIETLKLELKKAMKNFESLSLDWSKMKDQLEDMNVRDSLRCTKSLRSLKSESAVNAGPIPKIGTEHKEKIDFLETCLHQKQEELLDLRKRMDQYETKYGIKEASEEIRNLKVQMTLRDDNIIDMTSTINQLTRDLEDARDMIEAAKKGEKPNPVLLKSLKQSQIEKLTMLNEKLQDECASLEEERVSLKKEIRQLIGDNPENFLTVGLSDEQKSQVLDYVMALKDSRNPERAKSLSKKLLAKSMADVSQANYGDTSSGVDVDRLYRELRISNEERAGIKSEHEKLSQKCVIFEKLVSTLLTYLESNQKFTVTDEIQQVKDHLEKMSLLSNSSDPVNLDAKDFKQVQENSIAAMTLLNNQLMKDIRDLKIKCERLVSQLDAEREHSKKTQDQVDKYQNALILKSAEPPRWFENMWKNVIDASGGDQDITKMWNASLSDQLIECMHELDVKDEKIQEVTKKLDQFSQDYAVLKKQLALMYSKYGDAETTLTKENQDLKIANHQLNVAVDDFEKEIKVYRKEFAAQDDETMEHIQRENLVCKLKESGFKRDLSFLRSQLDDKSKEIGRLVLLVSNIDRQGMMVVEVLRNKLDSAKLKIQLYQDQLEQSVPKEKFQKQSSEFEILAGKYHKLLEKEQELVSFHINEVEKTMIEKALREEIAEAKFQLQSSKDKIMSLEKLIASSPRHGKEEAALKISSLEIELNSAMAKQEFYEQKLKRAEVNEKELVVAYENLDSLSKSYQREIARFQSEESRLLTELTQCVTQAEVNEIKQELDSLKGTNVSLAEELGKYKLQAEQALGQIKDIEFKREHYETEICVLRQTVQDLQVPDNDAVIARLSHKILSLEQQELRAMHMFEREQERSRKLETLLVESEQALEERERILWKRRIDMKSRIEHIQAKYTRWRTSYGNPSTVEKSSKSISELERTSWIVQKFQDRIRDLERQLDQEKQSTIDGAKNLITDNRSKEIQELHQLIKSFPESQQRVMWKLEQYQREINIADVKFKRLQREVSRSLDDKDRSEQWMNRYSQRIIDLETEMSSMEQNFEKERLDWDARELELESRAIELEEDKDKLFQVDSQAMSNINSIHSKALPSSKSSDEKERNAMLGDFPDPHWSVARQLEFCIRGIRSKLSVITSQREQIDKLTTEFNASKDQFYHNKKQLTEAYEEINNLKDVMNMPRPFDPSKNTHVIIGNEIEQMRMTENLLRKAIESMKAQLDFKEDQLKSYQDRLISEGNKYDLEHHKMLLQISKLSTEHKPNPNSRKESNSTVALEIGDLVLTVEDVKQALEDKERQIIRMTVEINRLRRDLSLKTVDYDELKAEVVNLQSRLENDYKAKLTQLEHERQELADKVHAYELEVERLRSLKYPTRFKKVLKETQSQPPAESHKKTPFRPPSNVYKKSKSQSSLKEQFDHIQGQTSSLDNALGSFKP